MILGIYPAIAPRLQQKNSLPSSKSTNKPIVFGAKNNGIGEIFEDLLPETLTSLKAIKERIYAENSVRRNAKHFLFEKHLENPLKSFAISSESEDFLGENFSKINTKNVTAGFAQLHLPREYAIYNEEGIFKIIPKSMKIILLKSQTPISPENYNKCVQQILNRFDMCLPRQLSNEITLNF